MKRSKDKKAIRAGLKFLADALDKLPDDEAAEIFNSIMAAYDEATESQPSAAPAYGLAFVLAPAMTTADPGRPNKGDAPARTLAQLIADPAHLARVEAILQSGEIKKPANVAHLAVALENLNWIDWQAGNYRDFFDNVAQRIGKIAGSPNTFKGTFTKARRNRQKNNENHVTAEAIQRYKKLLQTDEI